MSELGAAPRRTNTRARLNVPETCEKKQVWTRKERAAVMALHSWQSMQKPEKRDNTWLLPQMPARGSHRTNGRAYKSNLTLLNWTTLPGGVNGSLDSTYNCKREREPRLN